MKALLLASCAALALGSEKLASTPLHRGGGRIVGGTDASPGEFPHQIILTRGVGGSLMCGGSLVAPSVVVTAGHCCDGQTASGLGVVVGAHKLYQDDPDQAAFAVKTVILHEDYNSNTINNDICLLILDGEADFSSDKIGPIALPAAGEEYPGGTECVVTGWGTTSSGGSLADTLQKVTVPVVTDGDCRGAYGQDDIADSMICAGLDAGGKDSCQGDSGGPFMCGDQLSGVVSWGYGCAEAGYPGVYTQTSYFVDWIMEHADITPPTTLPPPTTAPPTTDTPTDPPTTAPAFECPQGWVDANPGCFRLAFNESLNRHDALLHCESIGGFLAEPKTLAQAQTLASLAQLEFDILGLATWWIGLSDQGHEGRWVWEHSVAEADFTDWAEGFPTPEDNVADCALMTEASGWSWEDASCGEMVSTAICQMENPNDPTDPPPPTTDGPTTTTGGNTTPAAAEVALVGGSSGDEGNVWATNSLGVFGVVCDDGWDQNSADVVCRQLGFGGADQVFTHSHFGDVLSDAFSFDEIYCSGSEATVQDCTYDTDEDCYGGEAAGVRCT